MIVTTPDPFFLTILSSLYHELLVPYFIASYSAVPGIQNAPKE